MAPPHRGPVPAASKPKFGDHFDPWNSSATGHQRAENRIGGSIEWWQSRNMKLSRQFRGDVIGEERVPGEIGAGSNAWKNHKENENEKKMASIATNIRGEREELTVEGETSVGNKSVWCLFARLDLIIWGEVLMNFDSSL